MSQIQDHIDEILSLRQQLKEARSNTLEMKRHSDTRNATIEECARVAESHADGTPRGWSEDAFRAFRIVASAIRALKDSSDGSK